ncbi:hypothetical protein ACH5RR_030392 [Cinchona calisaya]|uniref:Sulfotransferase n=1 Tax=Cinchona calisaya TaxID=153742 RepID=A0ABD2YVS4_9GENT
MSTHLETSPPLPPKYFQDDKLTQECEELLPSLPKEKGWVSTHTYQYQGTPWLKAIVFALVKRMHYHRGMEIYPLFMNNPHDLVLFLDLKIYVENQTPDLSSFPSPRLFATHLPFNSLPKSVHNAPCKIVYVCRNPNDTFVSLWHFTNMLRLIGNMETNSLEDVLNRFCKGVSIYGPFWDHVLGEFLDFPFSSEEEKSRGILEEILTTFSFDNLKNLEVNKSGKLSSGVENKAFFWRGEVGD